LVWAESQAETALDFDENPLLAENTTARSE
jgi:hypothetical protein